MFSDLSDELEKSALGDCSTKPLPIDRHLYLHRHPSMRITKTSNKDTIQRGNAGNTLGLTSA